MPWFLIFRMSLPRNIVVVCLMTCGYYTSFLFLRQWSRINCSHLVIRGQIIDFCPLVYYFHSVRCKFYCFSLIMLKNKLCFVWIFMQLWRWRGCKVPYSLFFIIPLFPSLHFIFHSAILASLWCSPEFPRFQRPLLCPHSGLQPSSPNSGLRKCLPERLLLCWVGEFIIVKVFQTLNQHRIHYFQVSIYLMGQSWSSFYSDRRWNSKGNNGGHELKFSLQKAALIGRCRQKGKWKK